MNRLDEVTRALLKIFTVWFFAFFLTGLVLSCLGSEAAPDFSSAPLPASKADYWKWGIGVISPIVIWLFSKIPNIPRPVLPILAPFVGLALGTALNKLASLNLNWIDMTQAGSAAVFIREAVNQLVTKQLKPLEESKSSAKPVDDAVAVPRTEPNPKV